MYKAWNSSVGQTNWSFGSERDRAGRKLELKIRAVFLYIQKIKI